MRWLTLSIIIAILTASGCSPKIERDSAEKTPEKIVSRDEVLGSLPCFKCHSYQRFSAAQRKGIFPHQLHMDVGYHCNQCHDVMGHKHLTVNKDICGSCHNIKTITFKKTALPSNFDHELHTKMFGCKECHPKIFLMSAGSANVTMKEIYNGVYCGACHDGKKAFASSECAKCHKG